MHISIFGTGYVGLVTGACLAEMGHDVVCVDIDEHKIQNLQQGILPIYEPGLEEIVRRNTGKGRLQFTTDAVQAVQHGKVIFSAVGTPPDKDHRADLQYVRAVAKTVGEQMTEYKVFVNKSTVPVGTGAMCQEIIQSVLAERGVDLPFSIVSNPEFLKEGTAVKDFMTPDRIVCGVSDEQAEEVMREVYGSFVRADKPLLITDIPSAELIKYAANAFLATKISFINEIANYAERVGADVSAVSRGMGLDHRIGPKFLHAGIGYGGSCFPKDIDALIQSGNDVGYSFRIAQATEEVNKQQKLLPLQKLEQALGDLTDKTIAIRGLSFKPKTDDVREAPSIHICRALEKRGVKNIRCYDPIAMHAHASMYGVSDVIEYTDAAYDAVAGADAVLLLTERDEFRNVDMARVAELMAGNIIIDGRNIWQREYIESHHLKYYGIGR